MSDIQLSPSDIETLHKEVAVALGATLPELLMVARKLRVIEKKLPKNCSAPGSLDTS
jgi:hypothetical protein